MDEVAWRLVITAFATFVLVVLLVPGCRWFALRKGIADFPAPGKLHAKPTPYLGGVAIAGGAAACSFALPGWEVQAAVILAVAVAIATVGLVDDVRTVSPGVRLLVEAAGAAVVVGAGAHTQLLWRPLDYVITVVWIVIITNAFNLLDNMDAAVGSIAPIVAAGLATAALLQEQVLVGGLAVVVAAACLAFLIYNWHPARIFMGDAGSLFLGFLLATISLKLRTPVPHTASAFSVVLLVGPAVFDTTLVVVSRLRSGRSIFVGGRDHTSHRLLHLGIPYGAVTAVLVSATTFSVSLGVLVGRGVVSPGLAALVTFVPASAAMVILLRVPVYEDLEQRPSTVDSRHVLGSLRVPRRRVSR